MSREELIRLVLVKLDEMLPQGEENILLDEPTPINEYINTLLDEAAKDILMLAPMHVAVNGLVNVTVVTSNDVRPDYIALPPDFLRMNALMLVGWVNPATELIDPNITPDAYMMARNPYAGAGAHRPKVALVQRSVDGVRVKAIEPFPSSKGTEGQDGTLSYVGLKVAEQCDERLQPIIATRCAMLVAGAGLKQNVKHLAEEVQQQLNLLNNK